MKDRLQILLQRIALLTFFVFSTNYISAQDCPDTEGDFFNILFQNGFSAETNIPVDPNSCTAVFEYPNDMVPAGVSFQQTNGATFNFVMESNNLGLMPNDVVGDGTSVEITFILPGTDNMMNSIADTFCIIVNYVDAGAPVLVGTTPAVDTSITNYTQVPAPIVRTFTDDCDATQMITSTDDWDGFCPELDTFIIRSWYVEDVSGNSTTITQKINIPENMPPSFNGTMMDEEVSCEDGDQLSAWVNDQQTSIMGAGVTDENVPGLASMVDNAGILQTYDLDNQCDTTVVLFFIVEDECGLTDTVTANYTVRDLTAPTMTFAPPLTTLNFECSDAMPAPPTPTVMDNCTMNVSVTYSETSTQTQDEGCTDFNYTITRQWVATDDCGNMTSQTQTVNVTDTTAPTFTFTGNLMTTISCEDSQATSVTGDIANVSDNCDTSPTIDFTETISGTNTCPQEETITRTWTVSDACGNSTTLTQTITVVDNTAPTMTVPADITINCDDDLSDTDLTGTPTGSDNCDTDVDFSYTDTSTPGTCTGEFTVARLWSATDDCGNVISATQTITVVDMDAPMITGGIDVLLECGNSMDAVNNFQTWLNANSNAITSDGCSGVIVVKEYTGTDTEANSMNFADSLANPTCPSPMQGAFLSVSVDFIAIDDCGNRDSLTHTFTIEDNTAPTLSNCPTSMTVDADGNCQSDLTLNIPLIEDDCNSQTITNVSTDSAPVTSANPGDLETPVNNVNLIFPVDAPPFSANQDANLEIVVLNGDLEQAEEFFQIYGEDGTLLGQTVPSVMQCASSTTNLTITATQYNDWATDGIIEIELIANIPAGLPGRFSVNDICGGTTVNGELSYSIQQTNNLVFSYAVNGVVIDTLDPIVPFNHIFEKGTNSVIYYVSDCAGNETTCTFDITVEDNEAPQIDCPSDMTIDVDAGECTANLDVPLFTSVTDNCAVTTAILETPDNYDPALTFTMNPNFGVNMADDKVVIFNNLVANATPGSVQLVLEITGDINDANEYFIIMDENDNILGQTSTGFSNSCDTVSTFTFNIPSATYNDWAADGFTVFPIRSFIDVPQPGDADSGINPCGMLDANNEDGISVLVARLEYESVAPQFMISGATTVDEITLNPPLVPQNHTLNPGANTVTYSVTDLAGNTNNCSYIITIEDNEDPNAVCVDPLFIDINPSGFVKDTIQTSEIDAGSTDNCNIASMSVSPNLITCDSIGSIIDVTLTVIDEAGNVGTCNTIIAVEAENPEPSVMTNCGSDTLYLFANPPVTPGGNAAYQCEWTGPNGFVSFECDPIILNADADNIGFYTVTITGITGCEASGAVQVTADDIPLTAPVLIVDPLEACQNQDVELTTEEEAIGTIVSYSWYEGFAPNGTLLGTTNTNLFVWNASQLGTTNFYVTVERGGCVTEASNSGSVEVSQMPSTSILVNDNQPCEGGEIVLTALGINLQTTTCHWTGPNGYESFSCTPAPITDITENSDGFYNLEVTAGDCTFFAPTVFIDVQPRPDQPELISNTSETDRLCVGETLELTATIVSGFVSYEWTSPDFTTFVTPANVLVVSNVTLAQHGGNWTVRAFGNNNCPSEDSEEHFVYISNNPAGVSASVNPSPACEGETVTLTATSSSPNVSFNWTLPNGDPLAGNNLPIDNVSDEDAGTYLVTVSNEFECSTTASDMLEVLDRPTITGVANDAPNCVNGAVEVHLTATIFPVDDGSYTYLWTGPNFSSVDANATIPAATADDSGAYTLIVTNGDGCESIGATTTVIIAEEVAIPNTPAPDSQGPFCEGEIVILTTSPENGNNVQYIWETEDGSTVITQTPSLTIDPIEMSDAGMYTVRVNVDGCESGNSSAFILEVSPKPIAVPQSNSPVCEGEPINLTVECMTGAIYEWQGPNGFSSSLCNPVLPEATPSMMDEPFRVRVNINGCWSDEAQINIIVKDKPQQPEASNFGPYCASTEAVLVGITPQSATAGSTYTWYLANTTTPLGQTSALTFEIPNADQFGDGTVSFYAISELDGCVSDPSVETAVELNVIPNNMAIAGADVDVCDGEIIELNAEEPTIGTGAWTIVNGDPTGIVIANPDQANTAVSGLVPDVNYTFRWTLSNGVCEGYSFDEVNVFVNINEDADGGENIDLCNVTSTNLNAVMPTSNAGTWMQSQVQELLGVVIVDPSNPNTLITGMVPGQTYLFIWKIDGGCGEDEDMVEVFVSNETAFAGNDFEACGTDGCVQLSAAAASGGGVWSSSDPNVSIISPNDPNTFICGLTPGTYTMTWFINDGACGDASTDEVVIEYQNGPITVNDEFSVPFAKERSFEILNNDQVPVDYFVNTLNDPIGGELIIDDNGVVTYSAGDNFIGEEIIMYELCAENCECSTATITIFVGEDATCNPPSIFTPNNDGFNDSFVIPCLADGDRFRNTELSIFNRWGDEVYSKVNYQNDWQGTLDGQDLSTGTYFYILDFGNGETPMSGFITIQR